MGRTVRVYTFFGKETVFADDNDVVIGDLAGMRPSDTADPSRATALADLRRTRSGAYAVTASSLPR